MQNYLLSDTFYGEIESVDEENGILTLESVATTGNKDEVKSFTRKVCPRPLNNFCKAHDILN